MERRATQATLAAAQHRGLTFADVFEKYCGAKLSGLGSDADRVRWRSSIQRYALPEIDEVLVDALTVQDMLRVLSPTWESRTDTAMRVRSRIEVIYALATVAGHRTGDNPARWSTAWTSCL